MLTIYNAAASAVAFATSILLGGASSNPSPEQFGTFLGQNINHPNAFNQRGLTIVGSINESDNLAMAYATYDGTSACITCSKPHNGRVNEYKAYEMFKLVDTLRENIASPGRAFIAEPLHDFRWDDKHCYVILMQCDMTIDEYTENMSAKEKADELPRLFYQILEAYMHLVGVSHNAIEPYNICVNRQENNRIKIMIRNFRHASALTYLSHDKVQAGYIWENRELFIEPPEHVHKIYDLRKLDTWDVGITLYRVLSATPPKKEREEISNLLSPLIERMRFLLTANPRQRPTPLDYIRRYGIDN